MIDAIESVFVGKQPWFAFVFGLCFKSAALCLIALISAAVLGRRGVLARSLVLYACLVGLTLLPAAALIFPRWELDAWHGQEAAPVMAQRAVGGAQAEATDAVGPVAHGAIANHVQSPAPTYKAASSTVAARNEAPFVDWRALALFGYAAVVAGAMARLLLSLNAVARLQQAGVPISENIWTQRLTYWRQRLNVSRPVQLLQSRQIDVPVVVGCRRPSILVPERLAQAASPTIDAILLHELAHVRRGDYGWNLLLRLVQAFYWANPLVWLVGRNIGRIREQACDEVCIYWLGGIESYRTTLLELAGALLCRPVAALGMAMAHSSRLQRRLKELHASPGRADCLSRPCWRFAAIVAVAAFAGALGALRIAGNSALANEFQERAVSADNSPKDGLAGPNNQGSSAPAKPTAEPKEKPGEASPAKAAHEDAGGGRPETGPVKVRVEKVRREDFISQTSQAGTLKASRSTELYARVAGLIIARHVNVGDQVKAGQVLAEVEAPEIDAELERAKAFAEEAPAAVEQAQGRVDETLAGLEAAKAEVAKSEAEVKHSANQFSFARKAQLRHVEANRKTPGSNPESVLEEMERAAEAAQGAAEASKAQLAAAQAGLKQAEAAVSVAKAGLRIAELHLAASQQTLQRTERQAAFRQITASADGIVMRQAAEPGSFAKLGGEPLFVITGTNRVSVKTDIPESDALRVAAGQRAVVWLNAEGNKQPRESKVSRVGYALDPKTRTLPVEIDLDNRDGRLRPGMYAKVTIDLETRQGALTLGKASVFLAAPGNRFYCFRVVNGRAVRTDVVPGERNGMRQEIKSGLSEGDIVITQVDQEPGKAFRMVQDGDAVEIVKTDAGAAEKQ